MYSNRTRMAATSGSPTMEQIDAISEALRVEALALCDAAGEQSGKMTDYADEHKKLETLLIEEAKLVAEHGKQQEFAIVMTKLHESMPKCTKELNVLHVKLVALLKSQEEISKKGADVAGRLNKNNEASTKTLNKTNEKKTKKLNSDHKSAMTAQTTAHTSVIAANQKNHDEARQKDTATHQAATTKLTDEHAAANSAKVVVNGLFLQQVREFVDCVEGLMNDHNNYAQIFDKMAKAITKINSDLVEFGAHTDSVKQSATTTAASVVAKGGKNKPGK